MAACYQLHNIFGIPVVLLGEDSSDEMWRRVMEADADLYLVKPFSYPELVARVEAILRRYRRRVVCERNTQVMKASERPD
ncbi:hypothetical protein ES708_29487 [subsurface metagenome]